MFELYLTGAYAVPELLDILNNEWGYRTVKRLKSGGTPLRLASLHNILKTHSRYRTEWKGINSQNYRGGTVSMARFSEKIVKKISP